MSICLAHLRDTELVRKVASDYVSPEKLTLRELAEKHGITYHTAAAMIKASLSKGHIEHEKKLRYSRSKMGVLNPMHQKTGEKHHGYKGVISDGKNYFLILKPNWFTSRKGSKHAFLHQVVFCQATGLTGIPQGFTIHHIDGNPANNDIHNLALVTTRGHARIHHPKSEKLTLWQKHVSGILR